ncbi:NifU-like domain [Carpediemonas membranifera]|uniref:NifU-like domain n=1 Tax=Carpediemonas membranifera TaxID=201153 RepID=A0A8J6E7H3_9EUKA|nr:NifU-like domain [Carpediemonas membranifera]|eukprot:KAG9390715.1 NifU-like domain [Carpediemonas membranifera]
MLSTWTGALHNARWLSFTASKTTLPNYFKFQADTVIDPALDNSKLVEVTRSAAKDSPLAAKLFEHEKVRSVLFGKDMLIMRFNSASDFKKLNNPLVQELTAFIESGQGILNRPAPPTDDGLKKISIPAPTAEELDGQPLHMAHLQKVLDLAIRPALQQDKGDMEIVEFAEMEDKSIDETHGYPRGVLYVRLKGACSGCAHSKSTMRGFVSRVVQKHLPNVVDVIDVE